MSMGRRPTEQQANSGSPPPTCRSRPGHVFYDKLNGLLAEAGFDRLVEDALPAATTPTSIGRPSIPPGVYFRMLLVGYFEGIDSQRGIAWRCADSLVAARPSSACRSTKRPPTTRA